MRFQPADLSRLSTLLDEAIDLDAEGREAWLARLEGADTQFLPTLRKLLAERASISTNDLIERGPSFTVAADAPSASHFAAGERVGPYRLEREIGQGGMGEVWLATREDGQLKRRVALKLPMLSVRRNVLVQRFSRERDILGSLAHPNIARLYDAGLAEDGQPYLALEYVEGEFVTAYCFERELDIQTRVRLLQHVLQAVQYAHANLVVHRDLKPSNVLVTAQGQPMLLDFGIAKLLQDEAQDAPETELTRIGGRAMTLHYAAPEQVMGAPVSIATDVWALGVLLYEVLTGERPFTGKPRDLEHAILNEGPPRPPGLPADLATIVLKALKKVPAERYATVNALAEDLERWLCNEPVLAQPDSAWYRTRKFVSRNKSAVAAATGLLVTVVAAGAISAWQAGIAREQSRIAQTEAQTATAVQKFMADIFQANSTDHPDPIQARKTTAEELLDIAGRNLDGAMSDSPTARLRMLGILTDMYIQLGLGEKAVATAKLSVDTAEKANVPAAELLDTLGVYEAALDIARLHEDEDAVLRRRMELSQKLKIPDSPALARIESSIGYSAMLHDSPEAPRHIDHAIELFRRFNDDAGLIGALFLRADLYNYGPTFDPGAARDAAMEGMEVLRRVQRTPGGAGLATSELDFYKELSESLSLLDDPHEAIRYGRLAVQSALALHQHDDIWARFVSVNLSKQLIFAAKPLDAIAFLEQTWHLSDPALPEVPGPYQLHVLMTYARAQVAAGRVENALSTVERASRSSLNVAGLESKLPADWAESSAMAWLQLGKLDSAAAALEKSEALTRASGHSTERLLLAKADLALARGDAPGARANVLAWEATTRAAKPLRLRLIADCILADAVLVEGNAGEADRLAGSVLRQLEAYDQRTSLADVEARALRIRGEMLLSNHEADAAVPILRRAVTLLEGVVDTEVSLPLASLLGKLAQAHMRAGNAVEARKSFEGMRQIQAKYESLDPALRGQLALVKKEVDGRIGQPSANSPAGSSAAKASRVASTGRPLSSP